MSENGVVFMAPFPVPAVVICVFGRIIKDIRCFVNREVMLTGFAPPVRDLRREEGRFDGINMMVRMKEGSEGGRGSSLTG